MKEPRSKLFRERKKLAMARTSRSTIKLAQRQAASEEESLTAKLRVAPPANPLTQGGVFLLVPLCALALRSLRLFLQGGCPLVSE
jgi:hypothetical protein